MPDTILVVDDELDVLDKIGSSLIAKNYKVLIAYSYDIALEMLLKNHVDLLISALEMPKKDGFYLAEKARKIIKYRQLPIVMLACNTDKDVMERGAKYEINAILHKPVELPVLHKTVSHILLKGNEKKGDGKEIRERDILSALSVLVVDDEENIRILLHEFLNTQIKSVKVVASVDEAIVSIRNHEFDVIITDIQMPERSGFELVEWINKYPETAGIPVIILTGVMRDASSVKKAKQLWIDRFIVKPFELKIIKSALVEIGSHEYQRRKLIKFNKYITDLKESESNDEYLIISNHHKKMFDLKKEYNQISRKIQSFPQDSRSKELPELIEKKAQLENSINKMQGDIKETKKLFLDRRRLYANIKRVNVQRIEKLK